MSSCVGLGHEGTLLMLDVEQVGGVVDGAVAVVVVADGAIEQVVAEDAVEGFALRAMSRALGLGDDDHAARRLGGAGADQVAIDLDHAGVAGLDGPELRVVADLREDPACFVQQVNEITVSPDTMGRSIDLYFVLRRIVHDRRMLRLHSQNAVANHNKEIDADSGERVLPLEGGLVMALRTGGQCGSDALRCHQSLPFEHGVVMVGGKVR